MKKHLKDEPIVITTRLGHRLTILRQFCKGCEICVNFCPRDVLTLDSRTLKVMACNPDACSGCRLCEWYCPDFAIFASPAQKILHAAKETQ